VTICRHERPGQGAGPLVTGAELSPDHHGGYSIHSAGAGIRPPAAGRPGGGLSAQLEGRATALRWTSKNPGPGLAEQRTQTTFSWSYRLWLQAPDQLSSGRHDGEPPIGPIAELMVQAGQWLARS